MELGLQNKNALVCGSTQGIGRATAFALAKEGVNVTLIARNKEILKRSSKGTSSKWAAKAWIFSSRFFKSRPS
jgi:short-subunit dehydrogenase